MSMQPTESNEKPTQPTPINRIERVAELTNKLRLLTRQRDRAAEKLADIDAETAAVLAELHAATGAGSGSAPAKA